MKNLMPKILNWMFKASVILVVSTIAISFFFSLCSCSRYCQKNYPCNNTSVVKDSFITIINTETKLDSFYTYIPVDSAVIKAEINCDENGKVILKPVYYRDSKKEFDLQVKNGWLMIRYDRYKDSILNIVTSKERTIREKEYKYKQVVQELKAKTTWQWVLYCLWLILAIAVVISLTKIFKKTG